MGRRLIGDLLGLEVVKGQQPQRWLRAIELQGLRRQHDESAIMRQSLVDVPWEVGQVVQVVIRDLIRVRPQAGLPAGACDLLHPSRAFSGRALRDKQMSAVNGGVNLRDRTDSVTRLAGLISRANPTRVVFQQP
jgi:hypothetical protein